MTVAQSSQGAAAWRTTGLGATSPLTWGLCVALPTPSTWGTWKAPADQIQLGAKHCLGLQTLILANAGVPVAPLKILLQNENLGVFPKFTREKEPIRGSCRSKSKVSEVEIRSEYQAEKKQMVQDLEHHKGTD